MANLFKNEREKEIYRKLLFKNPEKFLEEIAKKDFKKVLDTKKKWECKQKEKTEKL